nr:hybrid sensor histidine kinase/response regulator [Methylomarinum sp. Ch1-1]MDP4520995.1 response regulator [Methylomarinum sp. Ch1-1]
MLVTAYGKQEAYYAADDVKIDGFLHKPATSSTLLETILLAMGREVDVESRRHGRKAEAAAEIAKLRGAKVLLVEDNESNQELALELLSSHGMHVELAGDGQQALDMLQQQPFDGVLMDCQMPVMDGYTATRRLRRQQRFKDLPILAMTANAMAGDREKVIEAGMNDHISKPINVYEMFHTMAKWIKPAQPVAEDNPVAEMEKTEVASFPELPGIDVNAGMAVCQYKSELYRKLLGRFRDNQHDFEAQFRAACASSDAQAAVRCAHSLKGVAGNIGATGVRQAAEALEFACKEHIQGEEIDRCLADVMAELSPVLLGLSHLRRGKIEEQKGEFDIKRVQPLASRLKTLLEEDDVEASTVIEELEAMPGMMAYERSLQRLSQAVGGYDFELAIKELNHLVTLLNERQKD